MFRQQGYLVLLLGVRQLALNTGLPVLLKGKLREHLALETP